MIQRLGSLDKPFDFLHHRILLFQRIPDCALIALILGRRQQRWKGRGIAAPKGLAQDSLWQHV
ncbi:MAG: hypothetical protein NTV33_05315 [Coprothermobacterota bacterium]|nr:hypothetical protein [Coprothermobacterota bacterium]